MFCFLDITAVYLVLEDYHLVIVCNYHLVSNATTYCLELFFVQNIHIHEMKDKMFTSCDVYNNYLPFNN